MSKKEDWIEENIQGLDFINKVEVPIDLSERIDNLFLNRAPVLIRISLISKWAIAASVILLIGINSFTMLRYSAKSTSKSNQTNVVYKEYFSYINE